MIRRPSTLLALTEVPRALAEFVARPLAAPLLAKAPRGDGHTVILLPGFLAGDSSTAVTRRFLQGLGYTVHGWDLGRNLGPKTIGDDGEKLIARIGELHMASAAKISLVGWSLGGMMARLVAARNPDIVRQVISLGSPFTGDPRASNVWRPYEFITGQRLNSPIIEHQIEEIAAPLSVPTTTIFSRGDGVVAWENCVGETLDQAESIEVLGSHLGLPGNPAVLFALADRLAQREGAWRPFVAKGMHEMLYR